MKMILSRLAVVIFVLLFTGCGKNVVSVGKIDRGDKSIIVGGQGIVITKIRNEFRKRGWSVSTQSGYSKTVGTNNGNVNLNTGFVYAARYTFNGYFQEYLNGFWFTATIFDNKKAQEVATFEYSNAPAISYDTMVNMIFDWIEENTDGKPTGASVLDSGESSDIKVINYTDLVFKNNKRYDKINNILLNGKYKIIFNEEVYGLATYDNGVIISTLTYSSNHKLISKSIIENGLFLEQEIYYENGNLRAIIPFGTSIVNGKQSYDGKAQYYTEAGDLHFEVNYKSGKAVSGTMYTNNGPTAMTRAHFRNFGIK